MGAHIVLEPRTHLYSHPVFTPIQNFRMSFLFFQSLGACPPPLVIRTHACATTHTFLVSLQVCSTQNSNTQPLRHLTTCRCRWVGTSPSTPTPAAAVTAVGRAASATVSTTSVFPVLLLQLTDQESFQSFRRWKKPASFRWDTNRSDICPTTPTTQVRPSRRP